MGYSSDVTFLYGVRLSADEAEKLDLYFRQLCSLDDDENLEEAFEQLEMTNFVFAGHDTDSRVHKCVGFEYEDYVSDYSFGISSDMQSAKKSATPEMKKHYKIALKHLKAAKILDKKSDFHFFTQIL